jgi:sigma-B regulation protein RsbU (phosphoserine phosphatase)
MQPNPVEHERLRILITDDDAASRMLLRRMLEDDYEIEECAGGFEVMQLLEGEGPALVVLDYQMPDLNGAEVCELIRTSRDAEVAQTPIILLTAHSNAQHEIECLKAGADDFVTKPVNLAVLRARIDTHLRLHMLRRQLSAQNKELETWRGRHEEDLEAARLTQQAILPGQPPALEGWSFGAHYHPLMRIGGDIYDWVVKSDGTVMVWMSDATGHGASAALLTTLSKLLFRHAAAETSGAAALMEYVEKEFWAVFKGHSFMTAACVVFSPGTSRVTFCGAGQPPLLVVQGSGKVEAMRSAQPPLGLNKAVEITEQTCDLAAGEAVLLYTDGLYEMQNAEGRRMGQEGLIGLLRPAGGIEAEEWLNGIIEKATAYAESVSFPDDIAAFAAIHKR